MKSFTRQGWTLQLYWPTLHLGPRHYGVMVKSSLIFTTETDWWAAGFCILGFGIGIGHKTGDHHGAL